MTTVGKKKNLAGRCLVLGVGLVVMSLGVACSIQAGLGTSPISSLPYVTSQISGLSVGTTTVALHVTLILLQILLLRRQYDPVQLLQLPVALAFGLLSDLSVWVLGSLVPGSYPARWLLCVAGILLVGLGVRLEVTADVVTLAGEGLVLAVCKVFPVPFARAKVGFDVTLVILSCILSVLFLHALVGVREGTVAAALLVGVVARQLERPVTALVGKYLA